MGRSDRKEERPVSDEDDREALEERGAPGRAPQPRNGAGPHAGPHDRWRLALRPRRGVHLLLVARDGAFRRLLCEALQGRGHSISVAGDAHEAAALASARRYEVALLLLPPQGAPQLLGRLRDLDADLEVVWAPPPLSVGQVESLIEGAAARAERRLGGLIEAARALLEPQRPEDTAARLLQHAEEALGAQAALRPPEAWEQQQALLSTDGRRLRVPLWESGPLPEEDGSEDCGHRLELERGADEPELSRGEVQRAVLLGALGSLALTRAHCEEALSELYRELDGARQRGGRGAEPKEIGLTSGSLAPLERLAGVLAHELNNPLTFVLANLACLEEDLEALRRELEAVPGCPAAALARIGELKEVLGEAQGGAGRVREVVGDLTTLGTRDDSGGVKPVAVEDVVRAALRIARREVQRKAQVIVELEPRLPRVIGSQSRLGQVLLNLLLNAVQAVPDGEPRGHEVRVTARAEGEQVIISVSDTGGGIAKEQLPRVFDAGYTTKQPGEGSGLGLAISREIVRTHGGDIRIASEPGSGTTVTVHLPAYGRLGAGPELS